MLFRSGGGGELDAVRRGPQSGGLEITRRHHLRGGVGGADLLLELLDLAADLIGVSEGGDVEGEQQMPGVHLGGGVLPDEIGRASCRERKYIIAIEGYRNTG